MPFTVPIVAGLVGVIGGGAMMAGGAVAQCKQHHTCSRSVVPEIEMAAPALFGRKVAAPVGPCNVPLYNFDMCKADLHKIVVQSSLPAQGGTSSFPRSSGIEDTSANLQFFDDDSGAIR
jgi:hypothetical protein